jgi:hypothetical protein
MSLTKEAYSLLPMGKIKEKEDSAVNVIPWVGLGELVLGSLMIKSMDPQVPYIKWCSIWYNLHFCIL